MSNYNRNNRSGGGRFGGGDFRRRDSGRRQMHKAVCDECGKDCEVPFKPSGDKPIYCSECFEKKDGGSSRRSGRRSPERPNFKKGEDPHKKVLEQVRELNTKLDRILKVIEKSEEKKPVTKITKVKKIVKKTVLKDKKTETQEESKKKTKKASKKK